MSTIITDINIKDLVKSYVYYKIRLPTDLAQIPIGEWDVSQVTNMEGLFAEYRNFNEDLSRWDVSNVTNMSKMFLFSPFNKNIGNWNVSNVTNMSRMFIASKFNQDIGNWDVSNVTNMDRMFYTCRNFDKNIGNWDVSKVTNMDRMFSDCSIFNQDIGNWDVISVINMDRMFNNCSSFNQDLSRWNVSNVINMDRMFNNCPINEEYKPITLVSANVDSFVKRADKVFSATLGGILEPLVINPDDIFGNNNCTFGSIVELLAPNISNASVTRCMEIHELSRKLNLDLIFKTFLDCVGSDDFNSSREQLSNQLGHLVTKLELSAILLYNLIFLNLSIHNADEPADSWTHIYDNRDNTKKLVKHAIFNKDEGLINHPRFSSHPEQLFYIVKFIELLPQQIQVLWAKFYIKEFIEGYGQELETFDPTRRGGLGFIASCLNGNFEKILLSIRTAITQFYPPGWGLDPAVTEENEETEKQRVLKAAITGSEFQRYYLTVDINGPTLEGYRKYIEGLVNVELREKYLNLLADQEVLDSIQAKIDIMSGGKSARFHKRNKTFKRKSKKTIKKDKLYKRKKTLKKEKLYKRKKNTRNKYNR